MPMLVRIARVDEVPPGTSRRVAVRTESLFRTVLPDVPPEEPLVMAGDWNDWLNRLFRNVAVHEGFHIARLDGHRPSGAKTYPSRRPLAALDKILYREPLVVKHVACVVDARHASDHLPLVAELHLPARHAQGRRAG